MPETRYEIVFKDGVEISRTPYEVSDEELAREQATKDCNDTHLDLQQLLKDWGGLNFAQKQAAIVETYPIVVRLCLMCGEKAGLFIVDW